MHTTRYFLTNVKQNIHNNDTGNIYNNNFNITSNIQNKQNGVCKLNDLDPLFVNIYTSDINSILNTRNINYLMYAYDIQLYISTTLNNLTVSITDINKLTTELYIYFNNNHLKYNKLKREYIIFRNKCLIPHTFAYVKKQILN